MSEISRAQSFGKLSPLAYKTMEAAAVACKQRGNPVVELQHWLEQILKAEASDLHLIVRHFGLQPDLLAHEVQRALDRLPRGAQSISDIAGSIDSAVERGWVYASLLFQAQQVRTGHLLVGMLKTPGQRATLLGLSRQFNAIAVDTLVQDFAAITQGSPEAAHTPLPELAAPGEASGAIPAAPPDRQAALQRYTTDLTAQARAGQSDPIVGRDEEIRQVVDILMRRRQNNPILVGEAGVGKTAVVEGLAQRIVRGDVPPALQAVSLRALDIGLLQAGASMKGEFEQRLRSVIDEVQASLQPVILFIDETHTLVGAGGNAGTGDAANLLKPALARGQLRTIGATTFAEFKKHIEADAALSRRFQSVQVAEPDEALALRMLRGVADTLERHHQVMVLDEALQAAVKLSHRYIPARQLPDKAVSLLDTACARVAVSLHAVPAQVDDCQRGIQALETEAAIIAREACVGIDTGTRGNQVAQRLADERARLGDLKTRWNTERRLVQRLLALRARLQAAQPAMSDGERADAVAELQAVQAQLHTAQGPSPLMLPTVDQQAIASVVADWTGIPVGRMAADAIGQVLQLPELMGRRVIGQDHAMATIARRIQTSRAGLDNPDKPIGVFLLAGTSGVGKTETALALAEALYGGDSSLITVNMSEYQEAHAVSTLKGSPPGYKDSDKGGVLTEAVRRRPYSVVLLDEFEKAHPDVHELFYQVFDKGSMDDAQGRRIDFRNTLILLTTNVGTELISRRCANAAQLPDAYTLAQALREPLLQVFAPALLGRLVTIPYYPLSDSMLSQIVRLQLQRIGRRVAERYKVPFTVDDAVVQLVVSRCTESESGGRMIDSILTSTLLPDISRAFLERVLAGHPVQAVRVGVSPADGSSGSQFAYAFDDAPRDLGPSVCTAG